MAPARSAPSRGGYHPGVNRTARLPSTGWPGRRRFDTTGMMMPVGSNDQPGTATAAPGRAPVATFDSTGTIRIGRDDDNDIVLRDFWVSRKHAEIRKVGKEHHLVDLASSNGLHHNGRRVPRATLATGDRFTIGRHELLFDGVRLFQHDDQGPPRSSRTTSPSRSARQRSSTTSASRCDTALCSACRPQRLRQVHPAQDLDRVPPGRPRTPALRQQDLYEHYSELRYRIGMVPQDDVLHQQLTVRRALASPRPCAFPMTCRVSSAHSASKRCLSSWD